MTVRNLLRIENPCKECRHAERIDQRRQECLRTHGGSFTCELTDFSKVKKKQNQFSCNIHGPFQGVSIEDHLRYKFEGCTSCYQEHMSESQRMSVDEFISRGKKIYKNSIDYSYVKQFRNQHELVWLNCDKENHGLFAKSPANHLHVTKAQGCPICATERATKKQSIFFLKFYVS